MTKEEYLVLQTKFADPSVFDAARKKFFEEHPDCPKPKPVECLNLIMRKEYAEEILTGIKTVEIRAYSQHYCDRLYDKDVLDYENAHWDDDLMRMQMIDFNDSVRAVKKIHFHNYNNSWFLDVECIDNNTVVVNNEQVGFLQDEYNCHEFDEMLADLNKRKAKDRPIFFYFAIGRILATDLK
jgi:hypothetical protein